MKAICSNIDGPRNYFIKTEKDKHISYDIIHMWNLINKKEKTYLHNRNRLTDIKNKIMITKGEMWLGKG